MNMKSKYTKIGYITLFIICVIGVILTAKYNKAETVMATPETTEVQESLVESTSVLETESIMETVTKESVAETESTTEADLETAVTETEEALYTVIAIDPVKLYATANVNMRDLPDVSGNKVGSLSYCEEVTATGTVKEFNRIGCYWLEVTTSNGLTGFVNGGYLVEERPVPESSNSGTSGTAGETGQTGQENNSNSGTSGIAGQTDNSNSGAGTATPPANNTTGTDGFTSNEYGAIVTDGSSPFDTSNLDGQVEEKHGTTSLGLH